MEEIAPGVYVLMAYSSINVGMVVAGDGALAVDAPPATEHQAWRRALRALGVPLRYLIVTGDQPERVEGAGWVDAPIIAAQGDGTDWPVSPASGRPLRPEILVDGRLTFHTSFPVAVERVPGPRARSLWVWLPEQAILFTGDVVIVGRHPALAEAPSILRWLETLKRISEGNVPVRQVVPGRGPIGGPEVVEPLVAYVERALELVQAARSSGGARADLARAAEELMSLFPVPDGDVDRQRQQIRVGLERLLEETCSEGESHEPGRTGSGTRR
ncbi:MAG: hypothetical protein D6793_07125 [Thermoflexia bacterium]|nr:MAG: hypothetical protein D6793_07125 [Thermoflexia bacterium]